jgi:hypothetical protein
MSIGTYRKSRFSKVIESKKIGENSYGNSQKYFLKAYNDLLKWCNGSGTYMVGKP